MSSNPGTATYFGRQYFLPASDCLRLTHLSLASFVWDINNSVEPDQMPQKVTSDQILHCLLRMYFQDLNEIETYYPKTVKFEMDSSN